MTWETGVIIGSLGISFYLLYMSLSLDDDHDILRLFLMLSSWLSVLFTIQHITEFIDPTFTDNVNLANGFYQFYIAITIFFVMYWFLHVFVKALRGFSKES